MAEQERHRQGAIRACFFVLIASVIVFAVLGVISFRRQRESIQSLIRSNLLLAGNRLSIELEHQVAAQCSSALLEVAQSVRSGRATFLDLRRSAARHRPLAHLVIASGTSVRVPRIRESFPPPDDFPSAVAVLWNRATTASPEDALELYSQVLTQSSRPVHRARALVRVGATLNRLQRTTDAKAAFNQVSERFADRLDPQGRPFALISAFETKQPHRVRADFERGRWDLSAELYEYYSYRFNEAGVTLDDALGASYRFARGVEDRFRPAADLKPGEVRFFADAANQYAYTRLTGDEFLVAGIDADWVRNEALPQAMKHSQFTGAAQLVSADAPTAVLRMPALFPFWSLKLDPPIGQYAAASQTIFAYGAAGAVALLSLGGALFVMTRSLRAEAGFVQLRSNLIAGVTHDLKTPLTVIRLYADTLNAGKLDDPGRQQFSSAIAQQSKWLTHLIDNVLDFSRIGNGRKQYHLTSGDLAKTARSALELFLPLAKEFQVETSIAQHLDGIPHDPDAITRALLNLLDNAVKYSGDSRWIGVSVNRLEKTVRLSVEDRGGGIPDEEQQSIFESYIRGLRSHGGSGYGLGLFIAQHAVRAHGGVIEVSSSPGAGSIFTIVIPCPES